MYCRQEIEMSDRDGKWLPYNKTGTPHECRKEKEKESQAQSHQEGNKKITTIDGMAALDLIPHLGKPIWFKESEVRGAKVVEVYSDE